MKAQISAVIFDLDGTLLDTEKATEGILKSFLEKYGKVLDDDQEANRVGRMFKETAACIINDYNLPLTVDEFCIEIMPYYRERWSQVKTLPGANRLIRHLHKHGVPLALASNSVRRNIDEKISYQQGWKEMFSVILGGDEVKSGKPSPDIFLEAAKRLGADASCCLVIEDSLVGVTAAKAAGIKVVAVPSLLTLADPCSIADIVLHSLLEFQPELWGLPPFKDWVHDALPIELLYIKGRIQEEVSHGHTLLNLVPGNKSTVSLPNQISGVYIGWARKAGSCKMLKVIVVIFWEHNSGIAERIIMGSPAKKGKYVKQVECWGKDEHYAWIRAYSNALITGHRKGKGLEPIGYALVSEELSKRDIHVNVDAIKSHYDKARYLYNAWKWMSNHTGCGFNPSTGTYTSGNPEFWRQFKEKHPKAMRLKNWGYTDEQVSLLKLIFDGNHATGDHVYDGRPKQKQNVAQASKQPLNGDSIDDEIPRMQPDEFDQYLGEDIGDSQYRPFTSLLDEDNHATPFPMHSPTIPMFVNASQSNAP